MKRQIVSAACGLLLCLSGPLLAQSRPVVVVELYTSQGCSSCPPADANFADLTRDPAVMPLALHVDYWDYIGWADSFANPKFTERQKAYAHAEGSKTIYTPQFIVGGLGRVVGNEPGEVAAHIRKHLSVGSPVQLRLERSGDQIVIFAQADPPLGRPVRVQLVRFTPSATVAIERGENAGKTVTYRNIVTAWTSLGTWDGQGEMTLRAAIVGTDRVVVIVQNEGPGQILAAAVLD